MIEPSELNEWIASLENMKCRIMSVFGHKLEQKNIPAYMLKAIICAIELLQYHFEAMIIRYNEIKTNSGR